MLGRGGRQQPQLHLASHGDVALQLPLLALDGLVEAGILDGYGHLRGHGGEDALVFLVEEGGAGVFQVEHANDAAFIEEGHDQLGASLLVHGRVARILADIGDVDEAPFADRRAYQAAGDGDAA